MSQGEPKVMKSVAANPTNAISSRTRAYMPIFGEGANLSERERLVKAINTRADALAQRAYDTTPSGSSSMSRVLRQMRAAKRMRERLNRAYNMSVK